MRFTSVRMRLTLWNTGVLALVLVVLGITLRYELHATLLASLDRDLASRARRIIAWRSSHPAPVQGRQDPARAVTRKAPGRSGQPERPDASATRTVLRSRVLDLRGKSVISSLENHPWDPATFALSVGGREAYSDIRVERDPVRVFSLPTTRNGRVDGVVQTAHSLADLNRQVNELGHTLLTLIPLGLLVAGMGGAFLTEHALRPVRKITQAAERIEAQSLSGRLPVTGKDEFSVLASTFNGMLGRLEEAFAGMEQAFEQQRRFTADASHELRTPLTIIKANASLALRGERPAVEYRQALQAVDRAADMTNRIVQDLLLLARSDGGDLGLAARSVLLQPVLERSSEAYRHAENAPILLEVSDPSLSVLGNAHELIRLFGNLIDNASRHTPAEGSIAVSAHGAGNQVVVTVEDTGDGIAPEHLPHVCERFYRIDAARSRAHGGTGLGLAICRGIVQAHGGSLAIHSAVGKGTKVVVTLPGSAAADHREDGAEPIREGVGTR